MSVVCGFGVACDAKRPPPDHHRVLLKNLDDGAVAVATTMDSVAGSCQPTRLRLARRDRLIAAGHHQPGHPDILIVCDAGHDVTGLALRIAVLVGERLILELEFSGLDSNWATRSSAAVNDEKRSTVWKHSAA